MNTPYIVYGNVVLAPAPEHTPRLTVVNGTLDSPCEHPSAPTAGHVPNARARIRMIAALCIVIGCMVFGGCMAHLKASRQATAVAQLDRDIVTVAQGDTIWDIVERTTHASIPPQQAVRLVREWNHLDSGLITPGMELVVPTSSL